MKKALWLFVLIAGFSIVRAEDETKPTHSIRILAPDGTPAVDVQGNQRAYRDFLRVIDGKTFEAFYGSRPLESDADGNIAAHEKIKYYPEPDWLVLLHETGYVAAEVTPETAELRLAPWKSVRGKVAVPHESRSEIVYYIHTLDETFKRNQGVYWIGSAPIGEDGTFVLERLPEAAVAVTLLMRPLAEGERYKPTENIRCQYPTVFSVPSEKPLVVSEGGFNVTGKVLVGEFPALVRFVPKSHYYTHKVLTDNEGRFTIRGVAAGDYDLIVYKGGSNLSDETVLSSCTVGDGDFDFGELLPYASEHPIEIQNTVTVTADTVKRVEAKAKELCPHAIEEIFIGQLAHPLAYYGARITYAPQAVTDDTTRATKTGITIEIPYTRGCEIYSYEDKHKTSRGLSAAMHHFTDGNFKDPRIREEAVRIFPLRTCTFALSLDEGVDYVTVLAMLRAIENGTVKEPQSEKQKDGSYRFTASGSPPKSEDIPKIIQIRYNAEKETYEIMTRTRAHSGDSFTIKKDGETFILVSGGGWVS